MKTFLTTLLLLSSLSVFANPNALKASDQPVPDSDSDARAKPQAEAPTTTKQEQQSNPGEENTFNVGPYDRKGEYIFFDRLEREQKEASDEEAEMNQ